MTFSACFLAVQVGDLMNQIPVWMTDDSFVCLDAAQAVVHLVTGLPKEQLSRCYDMICDGVSLLNSEVNSGNVKSIDAHSIRRMEVVHTTSVIEMIRDNGERDVFDAGTPERAFEIAGQLGNGLWMEHEDGRESIIEISWDLGFIFSALVFVTYSLTTSTLSKPTGVRTNSKDISEIASEYLGVEIGYLVLLVGSILVGFTAWVWYQRVVHRATIRHYFIPESVFEDDASE